MFKSKTINENKAFYDEFIAGLNNLSVSKLEEIKGRANGGVKSDFEYFDTHNVSLESLVLELQEEFNEERLLLVDGNNINAEKQQLLLEKYVEFYLVRNENDLKIYSFKTGSVFEPEFILFLRRKGKGTKFDNLQIFIEPKGENLRKQDAWKEEFLLDIKEMAEVEWSTPVNDYNVWGVPFFTEQNNKAFYDAFNKEIIADTIPCGQEEVTEDIESFRVLDPSAVPTSDRFTHFLPLYCIKAACGPHEHNFSDEGLDNVLGWVDASEFGRKLNENMFVVQAVGHSMEPKISDGDYCVFERYSPNNAGSREGKIVLAKDITEYDDDYFGCFTIKQYHRISADKVELRSINDGHPTFTLKPNEEYENSTPILALFIDTL